MFQLKKYSICQLSGKVDVTLSFDIGSGVVESTDTMICEEMARAWIDDHLRSYLLIRMNKFINHKEQIAKNSSKTYYHTMTFLESSSRLRQYLDWFQDQHVVQICQSIVKLKHLFFAVLPMESNPSYQSSRETIEYLINLCNEELQRRNEKQRTVSAGA